MQLHACICGGDQSFRLLWLALCYYSISPSHHAKRDRVVLQSLTQACELHVHPIKVAFAA